MKQQVHIHYLRSRTTDVRSPWILRAVYSILLIVILTNPWQIHDLSVFIRILKGRNRKFLLIRPGLVADLNLLSAFQRRGKIFAGKGVGINIVIGIICSGIACSIIRGNLSCNLAHGIAVKCLHTTNILCPQPVNGYYRIFIPRLQGLTISQIPLDSNRFLHFVPVKGNRI